MQSFIITKEIMENRLDPFYYKPEYRSLVSNLIKRTKNLRRLGKLVNFSRERWNKLKWPADVFRYIEINGIDIVTCEIHQVSVMKVKEAPSRAQMFLRKGDIVISTTRPYRGAIAIIPDKFDKSIGSTGFSILRNINDKVNKKYLFAILRSNVGLKQMEQRMSGGNYPAITEEELAKIFIPLPPRQTQDKIANTMDQVRKKQTEMFNESKKILNSIELYLLKELSIVVPSYKEEKNFVIRFNNLKNNRYDPFYYQQKYLESIKSIEKGKYQLVELGKITQYCVKGTEVGSKMYCSDGIPFLRVKNIEENRINFEAHPKYIAEKEFENLKRYQPRIGEILFTKDGTIGRAVKWSSKMKAIISSGILRIAVKENVNTDYIISILNSCIIRLETERNAIGAVIKHLSIDAIMNLKIPLPPFNVQNRIANEINVRQKEAEKFRLEAEKVMEEAKQKFEKIALREIK